MRWVTAAIFCGSSFIAQAATPVFKCVINGTATFQQDPCPSRSPRQEPSIDRLNADEKRRREAPSFSKAGRTAETATTSRSESATPMGSPAVAAPGPSFRCDGRTHCSQMTSCAEARYFLANCPGVKMDGDRNGIPCELQWCVR
jgi:hypothetical protein